MPCFVREKALSIRPRKKLNNDRNVPAPKPVRPRAIRYHGLFSIDIAKVHMVVETRWTPESLSSQFAGLSDLLQRLGVYKRHEIKNNRHRLIALSKLLKKQCSDGRYKLQKMQHINNALQVRNCLMNHKDMQRLYRKMPIHLVVDNINQRTFVLRKERDRLEFLLGQRKREYKKLLISHAKIENHIKYENEFVLQDELTSRILLKNIENSNVRMKAIRTINSTYTKIVQVLQQDEIFYDPILRSLSADMEDQANMIKHILYLGMPVISKFRELNHEFNTFEDKSRQINLAKINALQLLVERPKQRDSSTNKAETTESANPRRYLRKTYTMTVLNVQLRNIERTIKELKKITLCSQAKEIYPNVKAEVENYYLFDRRTQFTTMHSKILSTKMAHTNEFKDLLINNLCEEEINRLARIDELQKAFEKEQLFEDQTLDYLKNRGDVMVLLRVALWDISEILRHVDSYQKSFRHTYPNSYLRLPLLKFEMLHMYSSPPQIQEEDIEKLIQSLKKKLYKLIKVHDVMRTTDISIKEYKARYHDAYLKTVNSIEYEDVKQDNAPKEDFLVVRKTVASIPSRKQIKVQSARILDEVAKRQE